ncbi:unnamed protein product [Polarella glacialis]|uniref:Uncharacterized protein n=1 Tax=Polarella glacialis TaxID=89957 RepID=A0A813GJQ6_POLGL|nr:unnamed protein product [Polarella glacialis]
MVNKLGNLMAVTLTALAFNGKEYIGSFDQKDQLSFDRFCLVLLVPASVTLCLCICCVAEPTEGERKALSFSHYSDSAFKLLSGKAFCIFAMYIFCTQILLNMNTPAGSWVGLQWAGVKMLQQQLSSMLGIWVSAVGLWLAKSFYLEASCRRVILVTCLSTTLLDVVPQLLTIFDIVCNQQFYLGEPILTQIPQAAMSLLFIFAVNELADQDTAGLASGILCTTGALGAPVGTRNYDRQSDLWAVSSQPLRQEQLPLQICPSSVGQLPSPTASPGCASRCPWHSCHSCPVRSRKLSSGRGTGLTNRITLSSCWELPAFRLPTVWPCLSSAGTPHGLVRN